MILQFPTNPYPKSPNLGSYKSGRTKLRTAAAIIGITEAILHLTSTNFSNSADLKLQSRTNQPTRKIGKINKADLGEYRAQRSTIPSMESELTGGLQMVMTATPSAPTSSSVLPLAAIAAAISAPVVPRFLAAVAFLAVMACLELGAGKLPVLAFIPQLSFMARTASNWR